MKNLRILSAASVFAALALLTATPSFAGNVTAADLQNAIAANPSASDAIKAFAIEMEKLPAAQQQAVSDTAGAVAGTAGAPQAANAAVSVAAGASGNRTGMGAPANRMTAMNSDGGSWSAESGAAAGDGYKNGVGVWLMPLYKHASAWDLEAGDTKYGYNTSLGGIALGMDYSFNDAFRVGLAGNMGAGYSQSTGDGPKSNNNFRFQGLSLYGGWQQDGFGLSADFGYTSTISDAKTEMPGGDWSSDIFTTALTAGLRGEYLIKTDMLDIMPHIGVRYTHLATYGFESESRGSVVAEADKLEQDIWTFPVGVEFSKTTELSNGWKVKPSVDLTVIPAAGEIQKESTTNLVVGGSRLTNSTDTQIMDYISYQAGAGLQFSNDDVTIGANYTYQGSSHTASHGVEVQFRYDF